MSFLDDIKNAFNKLECGVWMTNPMWWRAVAGVKLAKEAGAITNISQCKEVVKAGGAIASKFGIPSWASESYGNCACNFVYSGGSGSSPVKAGRFNGLWTPSSNTQFVSWGRTGDEINQDYGKMWSANMRLTDLQAYVSNGKLLYNGVWDPGNHGQLVLWGATQKDFQAKYGEMWNQGFRLIFQQAFVINGSVRYLGVWNPSNDGQFVSWDKTRDQINTQYGELWSEGYRLVDLQAYVLNDKVFYNAIWNPADHGQLVVWNWTLDEFKKKYDEMWGQGYRLICQQSYVHKNGDVRFLGVWNPSNAQQFVKWGDDLNNFGTIYGEWWNKNFRLLDMDIY